MLVQLTISNFAIINHLDILFKPGLNILSGETGAGKSIIINAVNLVLGSRASSDLIRSGSEEAQVEALFTVPEDSNIKSLLTEIGIPCEEEIIIKRTISREGPNRVMVNNSMATLQILSRIGPALMSISGQHEHQLLLRPETHLYFLDEYGGHTGESGELNSLYEDYSAMKAERNRAEKEIKDQEEKQDLARFQVEEIDKADLKPEEDVSLEQERERLRHAGMLKEILSGTYQELYERDGAVASRVAKSIKDLEKGEGADNRFKRLREALETIKVEVEEAAIEIRDLKNSVVINPGRLEEVEDRLQLVNRLKRKYGQSIEGIIEYRENAGGLMDNLENKKKELADLTARIEGIESDMIERASSLSRKRKKSAQQLEISVKNELGLLCMDETRFEVAFHQDNAKGENNKNEILKSLKGDGFDRVEFMISPNIGEEIKPLFRIASGGELSRIMLSLKSIMAKRGAVETVIFDEVDSGIAGATAEILGEKLQDLSNYHQILCITHLPQIASKGATHFFVEKKVAQGRTQTSISVLDSDQRVNEVARLLGGRRVSENALAHAREMLSNP